MLSCEILAQLTSLEENLWRNCSEAYEMWQSALRHCFFVRGHKAIKVGTNVFYKLTMLTSVK